MRIRHKTIFHYDQKLTRRALIDRSGRSTARPSSITLSNDVRFTRYGVADDIIDSITCRQIWAIPSDTDTGAAADLMSDFGWALCLALLNFGQEFVTRYIEEFAAS
jgi:hypothetical protein